MKICLLVVALCGVLSTSAAAQIPNEEPTAHAVANEGYFDKCGAGEMRACSYFARLVAWRLNPTGDPSSWGWLSKPDGGSNVEGWADDAMVYGQGQHNVIDLVGGAGASGARVQWGGPHPRRPSNLWVAPQPLTKAELDYLKPGSGPAPKPPPVPPTVPPVNLQPVLEAVAQLRALVEQLHAKQDAQAAQLAQVGAAAVDAATQAAAASAGQQGTRNRVEDVLTAVDLARQALANPPEYSGPAKFSGTLTLKPKR